MHTSNAKTLLMRPQRQKSAAQEPRAVEHDIVLQNAAACLLSFKSIRAWDSGFRVLGFRVLGFRVLGLIIQRPEQNRSTTPCGSG